MHCKAVTCDITYLTFKMKSTKSAWSTHLGFNISKAKQELGDEFPRNYNSLLKKCVLSETSKQILDAYAGDKLSPIDYDAFLARFCDKAKYRAGVIEAIKWTLEAMHLGN